MITEKYISKLLYDHDCVIVPELGGFIANYSPARIHPVRHTFTPPARTLAFNAILRNNDGLLANAIKSGMEISYAEAVELLHNEVAEMLEKIGKGEKISLAQIGTLSNDRENNIQFIPSQGTNYNSDSYGLTNFTSPAIKREALHEKISRRLMPQQAVRSSRRLPATLKWAAVFLPLISIGLWSAFNPEKINSLYSNYASFLPSSEKSVSVSGKHEASQKPLTKVIEKLPEQTTAEVIETPVAEEKPVVVTTEADIYFIIAGAFSVEENAQKLSEELRLKGYDSFIAGQNRRGLYRVTLEGFSDKELALQKISEFRKGEFPGAWLLTME